MSRLGALTMGAAAATLMFAGNSAFAQSAEAVAEDEEIVVTARKREESIQDVPVSVTALSGAALEDRGVTALNQIDQFAPGLTFQPGARTGGGGSTGSVFIRGIGQIDYNPLTDQGVGVYVDNVFLGRATGQVMDVLDIARVEVLRGPQGTLFGKNTIGGAISIVSSIPRGEFSGYVQAAGGSFNQLDQRASVAFPITDALSGRISLSNRQRDGYAESLATGDEFGDVDSQSGRLVLNWEPDAGAASFVLIVDASTQEGQSQFNRLVATRTDAGHPLGIALTPYVPTSDYVNYASNSALNFNNLDVFGVSGTFRLEVAPDLDFISITAYRTLEAAVGLDTDSSPLAIQEIEGYTDQHQFSQEFQLAGVSFGDRLEWLLGAYYFEESIDERSENRIVPFFVNTTQYMSPTTTTWALFTQGTYQFTDRLSATIGVRYSEEDKHVDGRSFRNLAGTCLPLLCDADPRAHPSESWTSLTPRFGVEYQASDDALLYFSYAEGFKSGGFNYQVINRIEEFRAYDPETASTYEVGFKTDWLDRRLRINGDVYYTEYEDLQLRSTLAGGSDPALCPAGPTCSLVLNAPGVNLTGAELEVTARPTDALQLFLGVAYIDDEYRPLTPGINFGLVTAENDLPKTPTWAVNLGAQLDVPLSWGLLTLRGDYAYKTSMFTDYENTPQLEQDAFGLLNVRAALSFAEERWEVAVSGQNVTDEAYLTSGFGSGMVGPGGLGYAVGSYGVPATWQVSLRYRFGE